MTAQPPVISKARRDAAAERLYALLPAHIRTTDAARGNALRAFLDVLASGSAEIDAEIDTLYDALFVETAPEAGLDDLGALVAAEPLRPLPPGSGHNRRAFIANTVRYRRGKGTARVLEALAADVGGFGAVAVEYFMRLARTQNLIDVRPERPGTGFLVPGETAARVATGFDRLSRLVDVRSIARAAGRHHVPNVGVHILRPVVMPYPAPPGTGLAADLLAGVPQARAWPGAGGITQPGYFQLAAQPGRLLRLFNPGPAVSNTGARVAERDVSDRLRRLPLHLETTELRHAKLEGRIAATGPTPWFDPERAPFTIFTRVAGATTFTRVAPEAIRIANLDALPLPAGARPTPALAHSWFEAGQPAAIARSGTSPIACGFDPATGRLIAVDPGGGADVVEARVAYGTGIGRAIGAGPQERNDASVPFDLTDDATLSHFIRIVDATASASASPPARLRTVPSLTQALAEWASFGAGKRGVIVLVRCDLETAVASIPVAVHPGSELHIVAAKWQPYVAKPGLPFNPQRHGYVIRKERRFTIDAPLRLSASAPAPAGARAGVVILDGLELTQGLSLAARAVSQLRIRHCTVRAPGSTAIITTAPLEGTEISIDRAIIGKINLDFGSGPASGRIAISGSVVAVDDASGAAVTAASLDAALADVTIIGSSAFKSLEATNAIFTAATTVTRSQTGCVRYSSIAAGSTMPRRFRCQPDLALAAAAARKGGALTPPERAATALAVTPLFLDTGLDEPTLAMLHPLCADGIRLGGENYSEIGVFAAAAEGLRIANIRSLFDDYVPFGLEAAVLDDSRSSAVAKRRNRP